MLKCVCDNVADTELTVLSELNTVPTSFAIEEPLFAFSQFLLPSRVSSHLFYLFLFSFSIFFSTAIKRIAGIHSNMFACVVSLCVCVRLRVCDLMCVASCPRHNVVITRAYLGAN